MNSLCIRSCKPTAHCNKSRDPVDQPKTLCLHRKLRPALEHPADFTAPWHVYSKVAVVGAGYSDMVDVVFVTQQRSAK